MKKNKSAKLTREQKASVRKFRTMGIYGFVIILSLGTFLGFLFFLRPSTSTVEKRTLTPFPSITLASFLDGSFFSDVSLWYSDTYPMRDTLIAADRAIKSNYGLTTSTMMVGGGTGDDIPTAPAQTEKTGESDTEVVQMSSSDSSEATTTVTPEPEVKKPVSAPDSRAMEEAIQNQIQQGLYVKNGAAYSVYYFSQSATDIYTTALNNAAEKLSGTANVYSILVPNNSGAMLSEEELNGLGGSDQQQAISYYYSLYDKVVPITTIETLREHNDEYLYFRTDHHWTQLAAYYVYRNFCAKKGWTPHELSDFETMTFSPFLGTFYTELGNPDMAANPDEVKAYIPMGTNDMTFWDTDGSEVPWNVIEDVSSWDISSGYYCYIGGDKPLSIIENPQINDGSSCLIVKESYGNCFTPFLVDHYQTVYIIDFRYANVNVVDFVREHNIQDLIMMNNITIIGSDEIASTIAGLL